VEPDVREIIDADGTNLGAYCRHVVPLRMDGTTVIATHDHIDGAFPMDPRAFIAALRSRGVDLIVHRNRLRIEPESAYKDLTDSEILTWRHHRHALKEIIDHDRRA
jgi:hypothetical protein